MTKRSITKKIDAITGIPENYRVPAPPCPRAVKIELTARCNFNCSYCATGYKLRDKRDMDFDFYLGLLDRLKEAGVEELGMFYLGESFILPWLPDAIRAAKEKGFPYVFLTTNGSLATPDKVEACMAAGLNSLKFSLNYADAEQFANIAQVKASLFAKVIDNARQATRIRDEGGYDCGVFGSYINYDGDQGERMRALVAELSPHLDEIYALPLYSQADLAAKAEKQMGWTISGGNPGRFENMRDPVPCWALFTEARVTYDGHLSACCFDHDGRFHMGDLNDMSFMDAWHSPEFQALRAAHLAKDVRETVCGECISYSYS